MSKNALIATLGVATLLFVGFMVWNSTANQPQHPTSITVGPGSGLEQIPVSNVLPINETQEPSVPIVRTDSNAVPSISTVVVKGTVTPNGAPTSYWYEYGETTALGTRTSAQSIGSGFNSIYAPSYITGLKANTTYWYRLSAENRLGVVNGATFSFRTNSNPAPQGTAPTVRTNAASDIGRTTANIHGQLNPNGSATTYWFEYGPTSELGSVTAFQSAGSSNAQSVVSVSLSNLNPLTRYFFRLNAQNQYGTVNGQILNFTTVGPINPGAPTISLSAVSNLNSSSARLHAGVNPNGAATTYRFEYTTDPTFTVAVTSTPENILSAQNSTVPVFTNITGLSNNTTYYYRIIATNQHGTSISQSPSFNTR